MLIFCASGRFEQGAMNKVLFARQIFSFVLFKAILVIILFSLKCRTFWWLVELNFWFKAVFWLIILGILTMRTETRAR